MDILVGDSVKAYGTHFRGFTPEEIADQTIDRIIYVGKESHPAIRDQALAFKELIKAELINAMKQAIKSDRLTLKHRFTDAGHEEITKILET